jgi:hypothetical protein
LNQDTHERIETAWAYLGDDSNLCNEIVVNPNKELLFEYDCN